MFIKINKNKLYPFPSFDFTLNSLEFYFIFFNFKMLDILDSFKLH